MTEKEKMLAGMNYKTSDRELVELRNYARDMSAKFNKTTENETELRQTILQNLLGSMGKNVEVYPVVQFDYGSNTYIGDNCYFNFNCIFLDCAKIQIGNNVFVGPNTSFLTPVHPLLSRERNIRIDEDGESYTIESCKPITIGDNVWIGGNVTVTPGVKIGHDTVIGAGSVVTKDIPPNVVAAGVPCRVIREITEADSMLD